MRARGGMTSQANTGQLAPLLKGEKKGQTVYGIFLRQTFLFR